MIRTALVWAFLVLSVATAALGVIVGLAVQFRHHGDTKR